MKYIQMEFISLNINNSWENLIKNKTYRLFLAKEKSYTDLVLTEIFWDDGIFYIRVLYHDSNLLTVEKKLTLLEFNTLLNTGEWRLLYSESQEGIYIKRNRTQYDTTELKKHIDGFDGIRVLNQGAPHKLYNSYEVGNPDWNIIFKYHQITPRSGKWFHRIVKLGQLYKHNIWITTHTTDKRLTKADTYGSIFFSLNVIGIPPITILNTLKGFE
jgi:hypothetical protein